jgi:flagellar hook assembly protein FlgD
LLNGSPNPFREETTIYYEVPSSVSDDDGNVLNFVNPVSTSVKIYNVAGRLVSILVDTILTPGDYNTSWQAVDASGNNVASGVYYIKLQIGKKHVTKRLIQLK